MRESRFWALMEGEFGERYAYVLADQLVISSLQLTAKQALAAGVPARHVWEAICEQQDVPESRRLGKDVPPKQ
ncbi:DUF3046 domain-containing protein [Nesterenkonia ebinurensis]|uniref:DUF3046 domain-containing protein n=1 Tax=Nesterenkonia ebinurensis TaxID=2608252 RepID=UPI00123DA317|nr:DUF3046 domain-containing protein [Nesterenkonia ebinurensis]